jgi:hypothetical protein
MMWEATIGVDVCSRAGALGGLEDRNEAFHRFLSALLLLILGLMAPASAKPASGELDLYTVRGEPAQAGQLVREGLDVVGSRVAGDKIELDIVLSDAERDRLVARGFSVLPRRTKDGKTQRQLAAEQAASGFTVWRSWDEPGGIRDELYAVARNNPQLVKLEVLGHTYGGRELIALKVTQSANDVPDASRPAVLYSSVQHAREWISLEVNRRLLNWVIAGWRANDASVKDLVKTTELWFVLVANPDGYQYTFDNERLWRKNLRDNDGNGQITGIDGVDPNRNFDEHFKHDEEGSSSIQASLTYRAAQRCLRAGDPGDAGSSRSGQAEVPVQLPLVRTADPLPAGLAGRHAGGGQPDLHRTGRHRRQPGDCRLRPRYQLRRALRDQR